MAQQWYRSVTIRAQIVAGGFLIAAAVVAGLFHNYGAQPGRIGSISDPAIYKLRVIVIDPKGFPVDDAKIWSSVGGEPKRVSGGWQFDIPSATKPADGNIRMFASRESSFLTGDTDYKLGIDLNPIISIQLTRGISSVVHGIVIDESGHGLGAVRIAIVGHEGRGVITQTSGTFSVQTDASDGQQILVSAEKDMYKSVTQWHPAGKQPITITLEKRQ